MIKMDVIRNNRKIREIIFEDLDCSTKQKPPFLMDGDDVYISNRAVVEVNEAVKYMKTIRSCPGTAEVDAVDLLLAVLRYHGHFNLIEAFHDAIETNTNKSYRH